MTDHAHELRRHARKIAHPAGDVPAVMLAAADEIERLRTESAGLVDDMNLLRDNNTALRARIEAMEKQEPVDLNYIELMNSAQKIVESYVYFRRFIASTPLENDIAVWMADFVFAQLDAKGEEK